MHMHMHMAAAVHTAAAEYSAVKLHIAAAVCTAGRGVYGGRGVYRSGVLRTRFCQKGTAFLGTTGGRQNKRTNQNAFGTRLTNSKTLMVEYQSPLEPQNSMLWKCPGTFTNGHTKMDSFLYFLLLTNIEFGVPRGWVRRAVRTINRSVTASADEGHMRTCPFFLSTTCLEK